MLVSICIFFESCQKFLDKKPDSSLVIPKVVGDLQALLDTYNVVSQNQPSSSQVSADDYYLTTADWNAAAEDQRRMHIWEPDNLFPEFNSAWQLIYTGPVYRANTVLDNLNNIERTTKNMVEWDNVKGHALFVRSMSFLKAAYIWALAYDRAAASTDLGIPLRLTSDFNQPSVRASVQDTYVQIIADLKEALPLLPEQPIQVLRPSKPAALALLARTYLSMREYDSCYKYANLCLLLKDTLLSYSSSTWINPSATSSFTRFHPEVILDGYIAPTTCLASARAKVDSSLYKSYHEDDIRKTVFFRSNADGSQHFRGSYSGTNSSIAFDGIATDEVWLMRAEANARIGNKDAALNDLNTLMNKRWKAGLFAPFTALNADEALQIILRERRKELLFRGLRWMDIKRLNKEGADITLKRVVNGREYVLPPNDLRYALPVPERIIAVSNMPQNPR